MTKTDRNRIKGIIHASTTGINVANVQGHTGLLTIFACLTPSTVPDHEIKDYGRLYRKYHDSIMALGEQALEEAS